MASDMRVTYRHSALPRATWAESSTTLPHSCCLQRFRRASPPYAMPLSLKLPICCRKCLHSSVNTRGDHLFLTMFVGL